MNCINKKKENIILAFLMLSVFFINIRHLGQIGIFTVLDDEFGYWSVAAFLHGLDWSSIVSQISYYSYGYSILLAPLFWIFDNPYIMYKAALIMNGIMSSASFWLCYDTSRKIMNETHKYILLGISFLIAMYPTYVATSSIAWCESLLILVCWLLTWCFSSLNEKSSTGRFVLVGVLTVYIYMVHQRSIGILIASVSVILIMKAFNKINWKQFWLFTIPFIILILINSVIKDYIQSNLWLSASGNLVNDYSAQVGKVNQIFTSNGLLKILQVFAGQIFYLGAATYLLAYVGLYELINTGSVAVKKAMRNKDIRILNSDNNFYLYTFLAIASLATIAISVIALINPTRVDHLVYGRYTEMIIGPIILIGILRVRENIISNKKFLFISFVFILFSLIVDLILRNFSSQSYIWLNAIGLSLAQTPLSVFLPAFIAIMSFRLIIVSFSKEKRILQTIVVIAGLFFVTGEFASTYIIKLNQQRMEIVDVVSFLQTADDSEIYFLWNDIGGSEDKQNVRVRRIADNYQFLLKEKKIILVGRETLKAIDGDKYLLTGTRNDLSGLTEDYELCMSAGGSQLLVVHSTN